MKIHEELCLIHPLMDSIAALSVGVPALDIDRVMLYIGSSSLNALDVETEPWLLYKIISYCG